MLFIDNSHDCLCFKAHRHYLDHVVPLNFSLAMARYSLGAGGTQGLQLRPSISGKNPGAPTRN